MALHREISALQSLVTELQARIVQITSQNDANMTHAAHTIRALKRELSASARPGEKKNLAILLDDVIRERASDQRARAFLRSRERTRANRVLRAAVIRWRISAHRSQWTRRLCRRQRARVLHDTMQRWVFWYYMAKVSHVAAAKRAWEGARRCFDVWARVAQSRSRGRRRAMHLAFGNWVAFNDATRAAQAKAEAEARYLREKFAESRTRVTLLQAMGRWSLSTLRCVRAGAEKDMGRAAAVRAERASLVEELHASTRTAAALSQEVGRLRGDAEALRAKVSSLVSDNARLREEHAAAVGREQRAQAQVRARREAATQALEMLAVDTAQEQHRVAALREQLREAVEIGDAFREQAEQLDTQRHNALRDAQEATARAAELKLADEARAAKKIAELEAACAALSLRSTQDTAKLQSAQKVLREKNQACAELEHQLRLLRAAATAPLQHRPVRAASTPTSTSQHAAAVDDGRDVRRTETLLVLSEADTGAPSRVSSGELNADAQELQREIRQLHSLLSDRLGLG